MIKKYNLISSLCWILYPRNRISKSLFAHKEGKSLSLRKLPKSALSDQVFFLPSYFFLYLQPSTTSSSLGDQLRPSGVLVVYGHSFGHIITLWWHGLTATNNSTSPSICSEWTDLTQGRPLQSFRDNSAGGWKACYSWYIYKARIMWIFKSLAY